jgi:hypothetical protein
MNFALSITMARNICEKEPDLKRPRADPTCVLAGASQCLLITSTTAPV